MTGRALLALAAAPMAIGLAGCGGSSHPVVLPKALPSTDSAGATGPALPPSTAVAAAPTTGPATPTAAATESPGAPPAASASAVDPAVEDGTRLAVPAPTSPTAAAVLAGWRGSWASLLVATQHGSAKDPLLASYNVGQQLPYIQGLAQKNISAGYSLTGYVLLSPTDISVSATGAFASLQDCVDSGHLVYNLHGKPTGYVQKPGRSLYQVRLDRQKDGTWAVSSTNTSSPPSCT